MPITESSLNTMAKDTKVSFEPTTHLPNKATNKVRHDRQISYEDAENCVNEMSESLPALRSRANRVMRQLSGSFNDRTVKVALILSVILNLLLGIPFGIFFGFWMSQKSDSTAGVSSPRSSSYTMVESCFPCTDNDLDLERKVMIKSKNNICCTDEKSRNMDSSPYVCLTREVFTKRCVGSTDMARAPVPCKGGADKDSGQSVAAAHLMLDVEQTKSRLKLSSDEIPLVWVYTDSQHRTFLGDGVEYSKGQIKIHKPGKYHIYSHLTLTTNENPLSDGEKIIVHSLLWNTRGASKYLLFAQVTMKPNEVKSTNIEGSFELLEGDVVSVYVSHPSFLKNEFAANVFGLFSL